MNPGPLSVTTGQLLADTFVEDVPAGGLPDTVAADGTTRRVIDREGIASIDGGALRLRPLALPGWGREGVSYGPVERRSGRLLAVHVLNGHHASQTFTVPQPLLDHVRRVLGHVRHGRWGRLRPSPRHFENLAVGFFSSVEPGDPIRGHAFVVHSASEDNGELWVSCAGTPLRSVRGLQNIPLAFVVQLRDRGAAYYAATLPGVAQLPALPALRPVGVDPSGSMTPLFAGIHQRILGEVGYRVDSRVYRVEVGDVPQWSAWYGSAVVADTMEGSGQLDGTQPDTGARWRVLTGSPQRGPTGLAATTSSVAVADAGAPSGLLHALVAPKLFARGGAGLLWRADGNGCGWRVRLTRTGARLEVHEGDGWSLVAATRRGRLATRGTQSIQVLDDGLRMAVHLDGRLLFGRWFADGRHTTRTTVGVIVDGGAATVSRFEAHPRSVAAPLASRPAWPEVHTGGEVTCDYAFDGPAGDVVGATVPGVGAWERTEGAGELHLLGRPGGGARVRADTTMPNPDRTLWTVPWATGGPVDVEVEMTPPGTARGQGHNGRGGLVLWQDADNYVVVNLWLDNQLTGTSVSSFYRLRGHEDMYEAVWTLLAGAVGWGQRFTLRVAFDGERLLAHVDDQPVLYRSLSDVHPNAPRLEVRRLGVVANEEWGNDTGTTFHRLRLRSVPAAPPPARQRTTTRGMP